MSKEHKRKRHLINDSRDSNKAKDVRKSLNSSERSRSKRDIEKELHDMIDEDIELMQDLEELEQTERELIRDYHRNMREYIKRTSKRKQRTTDT